MTERGYFLLWAAVVFVATLLASLLLVVLFLVMLPAKHFLERGPGRPPRGGGAAVRLLRRLLKNLLGFALVLLGLFLSIPGIPGQGLLTILVGMVLLDIPGKRRAELAILRRPAVLGTINRLRARFNRPPLQL